MDSKRLEMIYFEKVIAAHIYYINVYRTNHNLDRLFPDFLIVVLCAHIQNNNNTSTIFGWPRHSF